MAVSSLTTRRAAAPSASCCCSSCRGTWCGRRSRAAVRRTRSTCSASRLVAAELAYRIFGEHADDDAPVERPSRPGSSRAGSSRRSRAGALVCWAALPPDRGVPVSEPEPRVVADGVSKWFGPLVAVSDVSFDDRPGRDGAARAERRRQVDDVPHALRARAPVEGNACACSAATRGSTRGDAADRARAAAGERVRAADRARVRHALGPAPGPARPRGRSRVRARRPSSLDPSDRRRLPTYSKGMRQRVKVAQAIVHDPQVLVLDEPLTGLDPRQRARARRALPPPRGARAAA